MINARFIHDKCNVLNVLMTYEQLYLFCEGLNKVM